MSRARIHAAAAGLVTAGIFVLILLTFGTTEPVETKEQPPAAPARKPRPEGKPIAMPANLIGLEIALGLKDGPKDKTTIWNGDVELSEGKIVEFSLSRGGPNAKVEGHRFTARSVKQQQKFVGPVLHLQVDAPPGATVTVKTEQGKFDFKLSDLAVGATKNFLDAQASAERQEGSIRLTGKETEDDFPTMARGADGVVWLAYVEYVPGKAIVPERLKAGNFEELMPTGNGDQILLMRFDGQSWTGPYEVTDPGLDVWRPTVSVDGKGNVVVAWSQNIDGDWEICYRKYTPAKDKKGAWSDVVRLTNTKGSDFHVVSTTDASGVVWLAWQAFRNGNFDILAAALADGHPWKEPKAVSTSKANDWSPAITADSKGNVYIAYDTYDKGNYDVLLHVIGKEEKTIPVATSPRFEARANLVCDAKDRVWIAYEEGDEQWGKDFAHAGDVHNVGLEKNLGFALYINRTVRVKCLVDGKLQQPAADLDKTLTAGKLNRNRSLPRLAVDESGGVWLTFRHHPLALTGGEVWASYITRYNGKEWSAPRRLAGSLNLMDNRPALVPYGKGILTVFSGDGRVRTANRDQDDFFAALLTPQRETQPLDLVPDKAPEAQNVAVVHPNENEDVARIREARITVGDKKLQFLRGEFHRHTEFSSHNDGDGMLEDSWRDGLDAGKMDWMGNADHDNGFGSEYMWWIMQKVSDLHHNAPTFVAAMTYERSVVYPNGHRNVIMPKRGIRPLPRGDLPGTPDKGSQDTKMLYAYLKHFGGICASHTSGTNMGTDWRDNDPDVEPIVEIYQGHRHNYEMPDAPRSATAKTQIGGFEPAGFINLALMKGYRFGFESSSDHISTHLSYGFALAEENSRQGLIDAFRKRHCYAATDNILVDVRSGDNLMGDAFTSAKRPTIDIKITGTAPVAKVHVIRDNKYVYTAEPNKKDVTLHWTDADVKEGTTSYYYIRIEQADGNLAWASPMWITYKP